MESRDIEQQLADKLGNREIIPSTQAWSRISHNRQEGRSKAKRAYAYYGVAVAACFLLVGYLIFTSSKDVDIIETPQIVVTNESKTINNSDTTIKADNAIVKSSALTATSIINQREQAATGTSFIRKEESVAVISNKLQNYDEQPIYVAPIASLNLFDKDKFSDMQADALIENAMRQIAVEKYLTAPTSDTALLKEAEKEMDAYYREKAMKIFSLKHKTIRIAVKDKQ